jgi:hypothetical protein
MYLLGRKKWEEWVANPKKFSKEFETRGVPLMKKIWRKVRARNEEAKKKFEQEERRAKS